MPPKKDKKKASDLLVNEDKLQAVVLADSYETRFLPLTNDVPRCLLPLANAPLIEYTFEFLATAGVGEVYLMCCAHASMIENYIKNSKWDSHDSPFRVRVITSPESQSVGDVMRDLDTKGVIKRDFMLISGDVVCNLDFQAVLEAHNERKKTDKNSIMTMVLREAGGWHRTRPRNDPGVFVLDQTTNRCLRYETAQIGGALSLDAEVLQEHDSVAIRNDLIDCQIDICTVDIPALFQENFDYDKIRGDFVRGILTSDLLGKTIYTHIIKDKYAARVQSLQTYDAISRDVIGRYAYPIAPDSNLSEKFTYDQGHIYKEAGVVLSQSTQLQSNCVIGSGTKIGEKSVVNESTVGRNCVIGNNVVLQGAYVWDNVTIEDDVVIKNSIVANNAVIKLGAELDYSIVSYGVVVGTDARIKEVKLSKTEGSLDESLVGEDGDGLVYIDEDEDQESSDGAVANTDGLLYNMANLNISDDSIASIDNYPHAKKKLASSSSHRRTYSQNIDDREDDSFFTEAKESIKRAIEERHAIDVAVLELNTLRMTMNASYEEVREATMAALTIEVIVRVNNHNQDIKTASKAVFEEWAPMIKKQIFELSDQQHLLQKLLEQCAEKPQGGLLFLWAVDTLYDEDLLNEDHINHWNDTAQADSKLDSVKQPFLKWLDWLNTAESEDESDDESDDDE